MRSAPDWGGENLPPPAPTPSPQNGPDTEVTLRPPADPPEMDRSQNGSAPPYCHGSPKLTKYSINLPM